MESCESAEGGRAVGESKHRGNDSKHSRCVILFRVTQAPTRQLNLESGGSTNKPRPPKIKKINLADYFRVGMRVADLTPSERRVVGELLKKMLSPRSEN